MADDDERHATELVRAFYSAMAAGDVAAVLALASDDVTVTQSERLPWGGRFAGKAGLARFAEGVRRHLASAVRIEQVVAAGGRVAAIGRTSGSVVATGQAFDVPLVHLFTVAGNGLRALEVLVDVAAMRAALVSG